ncbi:MAG TPA: hypothetical protein QGF58_19160 [Myxococcota bacterium]|nr:hypothetical protein [Myxococcota bacterium]
MLSLLLVPIAGAGVWVEDLDATSVVVVIEDKEGEHLGLCADDGQGQDAEPGDGVWACSDIPGQGELRVALLVDGDSIYSSAHGELPDGDITLSLGGDDLIVTKGRPEARDPTTPRQPRQAVIIEIDAGPLSQAPVVLLQGEGQAQLGCQDNGEFPDRVLNDDIATCGGVAPGTDLSVQIRTHTGQIDLSIAFDRGAGVVMARYDHGSLEATDWPLLPPRLDLSAAAPQEDVPEPGLEPAPVPLPQMERPQMEAPQGPALPQMERPQMEAPQGPSLPQMEAPQGSQPDQPRGGAPQGRPPGGASWWSLLLAVLTLAGGVWLGRRMRAGLPGALEWAHAPEGSSLERLEDELGPLILTRSRHGPVVVVAPADVVLPEGEPGPVLRATSHDVLDLAEALADLRRTHRLRMLSLVIADEALLTSPGEVGLDPIERLREELPPGTRGFLL